MELNTEVDESVKENVPFVPKLPEFVGIKSEIEDYPIKVNDFDYDHFHENIFRTLSSNLDNSNSIDQVNDAFDQLENSFIENNILNKNGMSKFSIKGNDSNIVFLKYRDIDDAFEDMVITESNHNLFNGKQFLNKIDLKPFKNTIFSQKCNDFLPSSDNEDNISKNFDIDFESVEDFDLNTEDSQSENEICESETSTIRDASVDVSDEITTNLEVNKLDVNNSIGELNGDKLTDSTFVYSESLPDTSPNIENFEKPLHDTIRDIRVMVTKLPNDLSENTSNTEEDDSFVSESDILVSTKDIKRQVARKKTGGMVTNSPIDINNLSKSQKIIHQLSSKDGDFVPNVFDKMTRAGKRDLERVLAESTATLVMQKTSELITEKMKELPTNENDSDGSGSEEENEENEIHKTAKIVTNTLIELFTKVKIKKLDKLGKEISEEIANRVNIFKQSNESEILATEPISQSTEILPDQLTIPEIKVDKTLVKPSNDDVTDENSFRRTTREYARKKSLLKSPTKDLELVEDVTDIVKNENELDMLEMDIDLDEPRRPETRQSKFKHELNLKKAVPELAVVSKPKSKPVTRRNKGKRKGKKQSGRKVSATNNSRALRCEVSCSVSDSDIDSNPNTNEEHDAVCDSSVTKSNTILKASADSTTSELESITDGNNFNKNNEDNATTSLPEEEMISDKAHSKEEVLKEVDYNRVHTTGNDFKSDVHSTENKENITFESSEINQKSQDGDQISIDKSKKGLRGKNLIEEESDSVRAGEINNVSSQVLNDIITSIETDDKKPSLTIKENDSFKDLLIQNIEPSTDAASFLNYSLDDSLGLFIVDSFVEDDVDDEAESILDVKQLSDTFIKKVGMNEPVIRKFEITPNSGNDKDNVMKGVHNIEIDDCKKKSVDPIDEMKQQRDEQDSKENVIKTNDTSREVKVPSVPKPMTNEEKIAQLTKRDPRLVNEKKISNVSMRDPRIRNKLPKTDEVVKQTILESPLSPDPEPSVNLKIERQIDDEKLEFLHMEKEQKQQQEEQPQQKQEEQQQSNCRTVEMADNTESSRKKRLKKEFDEELLYKTPLSDLHEANHSNSRSTYERNSKKRPPPRSLLQKERENESRIRRNRNCTNDITKSSYNKPIDDDIKDRYLNNHDNSYRDHRNFASNMEEENRRKSDDYYYENQGGKFDDRNSRLVERENQDYGSGPGSWADPSDRHGRWQHENIPSNDRRMSEDSLPYSRRSFYHHNQYSKQQEYNNNNSSRCNNRQQNSCNTLFYGKRDSLSVDIESGQGTSSTYPPPLLPERNYNDEERYYQNHCEMDIDSNYSPPSSTMRSPSPDRLRPLMPGPDDRDYDEYNNRQFYRNYERDEHRFRGRNNNYSRDLNNRYTNNNNNSSSSSNIGHWNEEIQSRNRINNTMHDDDRWRRQSVDYQPRHWSREGSPSPTLPFIGQQQQQQQQQHPWDSPAHEQHPWRNSPSPPRWHDSYRDRTYRHYNRYT